MLAWATAGVFGLGAAAMTMSVRLRKERPATPPPAPVSPPPVAPPPPSVPGVPGYGGPRPSESFSSAVPAPPSGMAFRAADVPAAMPDAHSAFPDEAPPVPPPPPAAPAPPPFAVGPPIAPPPVLPAGLALYPRASFFDRMAALALDLVLIAIAYNFLDRWWWRDDEAFVVMVLAYHVAFWAWKGTTLGGIICNLRVVRTNGENPRFVDALVRGLSGIFSVVALGLGLFWMINDAQRQMWHDKIAGTVVVKLPREMVLA
jgi:RDD family